MNTVILVIHLSLFERLPVFRKKCTTIIPHFTLGQTSRQYAIRNKREECDSDFNLSSVR